jgi:hypothetical protein
MKRTLSVAVLMIVSAAPVVAQPPHAQKPNKHVQARNNELARDYPVAAVDYLPPQDVRILREHYEPRYKSLPPGLAKKYARTGTLPPGWEKKIEPIPVAVERRLVTLPPEYRRGYIDGAVVIYSPRTQVVVDVVALLGH